MNLEHYMNEINNHISKMYDGYIGRVSKMTGYHNIENLLSLEAAELKNLIASTKSELKYRLEESNPSIQITMPELQIPPFKVNKEDVYIVQTVGSENMKSTFEHNNEGEMGVVICLGVGVLGGVAIGTLCKHPITGAVIGGATGTIIGYTLRYLGNSAFEKGTQDEVYEKEVFSRNNLVEIIKKRKIEVGKAFEVYIKEIEG